MSHYINLSQDTRLLCPSDVMDRIAYKLNESGDTPPFLMISSATSIKGPNVMPTGWHDYFSPNTRNKKPCIYDTQADTFQQIISIINEAPEIAAIINRDPGMEGLKSSRHRESLPLHIAGDPGLIPFDPANGMEMEAILNMAIKERNNLEGIVYLSAHSCQNLPPPPNVDVWPSDITKGIYLYKQPAKGNSDARILAAGRSVSLAHAAASTIEHLLGLQFEIWSCPSFTMASRGAERQEKISLPSIVAPPQDTHLDNRLKDDMPTMALTHYHSLICEQVARKFSRGFHALGKLIRTGATQEEEASCVNRVALHCVYHLYKTGLISKKELTETNHELGHNSLQPC